MRKNEFVKEVTKEVRPRFNELVRKAVAMYEGEYKDGQENTSK